MAIPEETVSYIESQIEYYTNEAESYRQIAEGYSPIVDSIPDTAFGIITGCIYSAFLQAYQNLQQSPSLEEVQEFNKILAEHAPSIKKAILGATNTGEKKTEE